MEVFALLQDKSFLILCCLFKGTARSGYFDKKKDKGVIFIYQSDSFITPPLIKIFPKKENAERKKENVKK